MLGVTLAAHGYNKFFGGGRIPGTARWVESIGMKPGKFHATVVAATEMAAGLGLAVGMLTPIPAASFVALTLVAPLAAGPSGMPSAQGARRRGCREIRSDLVLNQSNDLR